MESRTLSDQYDGRIRVKLDSQQLRSLSQVHLGTSLLHIFLEWAWITSALSLAIYINHWFVYIFAVIFVGARQHAIGVLVHDASHYRFCKNKKLNDIISDLFLAWPLIVTTAGYRKYHFLHHRYVNTDSDPDFISKQTEDWQFPKSKAAIFGIILRDLFGLSIPQQFKDVIIPLNGNHDYWLNSWRYRLLRVAYYTLILLALFLLPGNTAWIVLGLWFAAYFTWLKFVLRLRSIAEHFGVENEHACNKTRTTMTGWLENIFIAPKNVGYHLEHHLFPSVPFYRLPELHRHLENSADFSERAHITDGYLNVLQECSR